MKLAYRINRLQVIEPSFTTQLFALQRDKPKSIVFSNNSSNYPLAVHAGPIKILRVRKYLIYISPMRQKYDTDWH